MLGHVLTGTWSDRKSRNFLEGKLAIFLGQVRADCWRSRTLCWPTMVMEFSTILGPRTSQKVPQPFRNSNGENHLPGKPTTSFSEGFTWPTTCQGIKGSRLWSRQGCTNSTALWSSMRSSRKNQIFSMLYIASLRRVHMYNIVHVLNVKYLAD